MALPGGGAGASSLAPTAAIEAYFQGALDALDALPVDPAGTPFQLRVWSELRRIPRGCTRTYGEIARAVGSPKACRAVGQANRRNPISIVIPCHRVVAAGGDLGGYSAGLRKKRWLLAHEAGQPALLPRAVATL